MQEGSDLAVDRQHAWDGAALAAVTIYAAVPWCASIAWSARWGEFAWIDLLVAASAVWLVVPCLLMTMFGPPAAGVLRLAVGFLLVGAAVYVLLMLVFRYLGLGSSDWSEWLVGMGLWSVLLLLSVGLGLTAILLEPVMRSVSRAEPLKRLRERPETWRDPFLMGVVSCIALGPVMWAVSGTALVPAVVGAFVVGLNVLGWALWHCRPAVVLRWVVVLGLVAVVLVTLPPSLSPAWVLVVGLGCASALGALASRTLLPSPG